ncbi:MAG: hypothetical protein KZQ99_05575 [Candidatus Thiodiazotropha sp. (ex Dulcina madagascariensis)]|nr:hypothetical protein [Candidatus Thiodiazotropha sp. (ex Dulcina madagascariensis)]
MKQTDKACLLEIYERYASQTDAPKLYTLASTTAASSASPNAANGAKDTAKAVNSTPNAPSLRCKLAELVNVGFAIGYSFINMASVFQMLGIRPFRLLLLFKLTRYFQEAANLAGQLVGDESSPSTRSFYT